MVKFFREIIKDMRNGENIEIYITEIICLVVVVLGFCDKVPSSIVTAVILFAIGVLLYDVPANKSLFRKLYKFLQDTEARWEAKAYFKDRSEYDNSFEATISNAEEVYFLGPSLMSVWSRSQYIREEKLTKQGANIRILVLDPESSAIESSAKCMNEKPENLKSDINRTISCVKQWKTVINGSFELREMVANPNYSMVLLDPDKPNGKIFVEFIGYDSRLDLRPHIELTRQHDYKWYSYFREQYDKLRKDSLPVIKFPED
jgi:hypothetical protein